MLSAQNPEIINKGLTEDLIVHAIIFFPAKMETQKQQITQIKQELEKQLETDKSQEKLITQLERELVKQKERTSFAMKLSFNAMKALQDETKKHVGTAMIAAFGFLIALVWKDAIMNYTSHITSFLRFPISESFQILYIAIITSLIAVVGIILINLWMPKQADLLKNSVDQGMLSARS